MCNLLVDATTTTLGVEEVALLESIKVQNRETIRTSLSLLRVDSVK